MHDTHYKISEITESFIYSIPSLSHFIILNKVPDNERKLYLLGIYHEGHVIDTIYTIRLAIAEISNNEIFINYYRPEIKQKLEIDSKIYYEVIDKKYRDFYTIVDVYVHIKEIKIKNGYENTDIEKISTKKQVYFTAEIDKKTNEFYFTPQIEYFDHFKILDTSTTYIYSVKFKCNSQELLQLLNKHKLFIE